MEHNTSDNPQQHSSSEQPNAFREALIRKVRSFLQGQLNSNREQVRCLRRGFGFALIHANTPAGNIEQLVEQEFGCSLQQLIRKAPCCGLRIKNVPRGKHRQEMTIFIAKQKLVETEQQKNQLQLPSSSEEDDGFPKEEEMEAFMRDKQQKEQQGGQGKRPNFVKPTIFLSKAHSEGHAGVQQSRKDDASIEVKLQEHTSPLLPFDSDRPKRTAQANNYSLSESFPLDMSDRLKLERANYERCSKLIDGTIIELLQAQRSRKVQDKREQLMERVAEIYDLLSNSIENGGQVIRLAGEKQCLKQEQKVQEE